MPSSATDGTQITAGTTSRGEWTPHDELSSSRFLYSVTQSAWNVMEHTRKKKAHFKKIRHFLGEVAPADVDAVRPCTQEVVEWTRRPTTTGDTMV